LGATIAEEKMTEIYHHASLGQHDHAASKPPSLTNMLFEFHHILDKNLDHCVPSVFCLANHSKKEKKSAPRKSEKLRDSVDSGKLAFCFLDSYLGNSNGSGLTMDTVSVTSGNSQGASLNLSETDNGPFVKKAWTTDGNKYISKCNINHQPKSWRSTYGNCHTICTRISRRQSISIPRQRSPRDVSIPEDSLAEDDNDHEFSQSANEMFYDPVGTYHDDSVSDSSVSTNYTTYSKWRDSVVSKDNDDNDDDHTEGKSIRSILSSSSRLLELPRDVEFDSCDSSTSNDDDGDELNADLFDTKWYHQKVRHW
jgi:hypothetical protein